jgi:peptidyl-prolyl cis-trans isomerase A (cyclophilin A)
MRSTMHWLTTTMMILSVLLPAQAAWSQTSKASPERPQIRVIGVVGEPLHVASDKTESTLKPGDRLDYGSRIMTGEEARAAITIRWSRDVPGESLDLLLLGPSGDITFMTNDALDNEASSRAVVIRTSKGVVRVVARAPGNATELYLKEGPRETRCVKTDLILQTNPTTKSTAYLCRFGQVGIRHVSRLMMINNGLMREIEKGELLGARRFASFQWQELEKMTNVPGVDASFPRIESGEAGEGAPRAPRQPGRNARPTAVQPEGEGAPAAEAEPAEASEEKGLEYVRIVTSMGDIDLELNREKAPITVANFLTYVDDGFYEGTVFHRVIADFMIQGGGLTPDLQRKPTAEPIKNEWRNGLKNVRGSIAMARTNAPDSATSQFFINVKDNPPLDQPRGGAAYAVFGRVIAGMDVVDEIRSVETGVRSGRRDVPVVTVMIKEIRRIAKPESAKAEADERGE